MKKLAEVDLLHQFKIDSAGIPNFHPDRPPNMRSEIMPARKRGDDLTKLRARPVVESDLEEFGLILGMEWDS